MTTAGFIGSGMIGGTVARLSVAAGHHVVLSNSRGPRTLTGLVAELGPLAAFLDSIGYDAVDAGTLADSWRQDSGSPVYGTPYGPFSDENGTPAGAGAISAGLAAARR